MMNTFGGKLFYKVNGRFACMSVSRVGSVSLIVLWPLRAGRLGFGLLALACGEAGFWGLLREKASVGPVSPSCPLPDCGLGFLREKALCCPLPDCGLGFLLEKAQKVEIPWGLAYE